jgi:ligand-binding sensor protein
LPAVARGRNLVFGSIMPGIANCEGEANANRELVDSLRRSKLFRDYERVFSEATGLPLALRPLEYWQLSHRGKRHENPFCALLAENPKSLAVCLQAHEEMVRHTGDQPSTITCPFGLTETAVPLKLGTETIGYLRVGQVLRHSPSRGDTVKVNQTLTRIGVRFSPKIRRAWEKNPFLPPERYSAIVRLLSFFAECFPH